MANGRHIENRKNLNEKSSDFILDEICYINADLKLDDSYVTNKIQGHEWPPYWKSFLAITQQPVARFE